MDILLIAVLVIVVGVVAAALLGNPLVIIVALIVGALIANRRGYRHQAQAIRSELSQSVATAPPPPARASAATVEERFATVERLRTSGMITDAEAAARRSAILDEL